MPKYKSKLMKSGAHKGEYRYSRVLYAKTLESVPAYPRAFLTKPPHPLLKQSKPRRRKARKPKAKVASKKPKVFVSRILKGQAKIDHDKLLARIDKMTPKQYKAYRKKWHSGGMYNKKSSKYIGKNEEIVSY